MAKKCFVAFGKGLGYGTDNGYWYEDIFCADSVTHVYEPTNPYTGNTPWMRVYVDGNPSSGSGHYPGTQQVVEVSTYPLADQYCPSPRGGRNGNCDSCLFPPQKFDCLNGACTPKTTYNTPGLYSSLSDCQQACGTGCSGVCVSASDWAQIEGLASRNKSQNCS